MNSECVNCDDLMGELSSALSENDGLRARAEAAEARLAAVEALCGAIIEGPDAEPLGRCGCETAGEADVLVDFAAEVRAAARGDATCMTRWGTKPSCAQCSPGDDDCYCDCHTARGDGTGPGR